MYETLSRVTAHLLNNKVFLVISSGGIMPTLPGEDHQRDHHRRHANVTLSSVLYI